MQKFNGINTILIINNTINRVINGYSSRKFIQTFAIDATCCNMFGTTNISFRDQISIAEIMKTISKIVIYQILEESQELIIGLCLRNT